MKNEVIKNLVERRSVRSYKDTPIPEELLDEILTAGTYAPTGRNRQAPIIIAVTDRTLRDRLSRINASIMGVDSDPFYGAPAVLIVLADRTVPTYLYDGSLVMGNLMNAAHALGIGSCWIHRAKETFETEEGKEILRELGIEGELEGIGNCIRVYGDVESCLFQSFMERSLDRACVVHYDRRKLAFPHRIPVYRRYKCRCVFNRESQSVKTAENYLQSLCVVHVLLYVAFEERVFAAERFERKLAYFRCDDFCVFFCVWGDLHRHFYIFLTVHMRCFIRCCPDSLN